MPVGDSRGFAGVGDAGHILLQDAGLGTVGAALLSWCHTRLCPSAANLRASLPLPEYCGATGRLNLATYLRGQRGRRWLRPRVCAAYGECHKRCPGCVLGGELGTPQP